MSSSQFGSPRPKRAALGGTRRSRLRKQLRGCERAVRVCMGLFGSRASNGSSSTSDLRARSTSGGSNSGAGAATSSSASKLPTTSSSSSASSILARDMHPATAQDVELAVGASGIAGLSTPAKLASNRNAEPAKLWGFSLRMSERNLATFLGSGAVVTAGARAAHFMLSPHLYLFLVNLSLPNLHRASPPHRTPTRITPRHARRFTAPRASTLRTRARTPHNTNTWTTASRADARVRRLFFFLFFLILFIRVRVHKKYT